jgi:hypothetical protein
MTDEEFLHDFEAGLLSEDRFHHADHVRLAWLYVSRYPLLEALARFSQGLQDFARRHGKLSRYHETITWAYVLLINERRQRCGTGQGWSDFCVANADLLDWRESILRSYYRSETLGSSLARRVFLFPDKNMAGQHTDSESA